MKASFRTAKWVPPRNTIGDLQPEDASLHRRSQYPKLVISSSCSSVSLKRKQVGDPAQVARNEAVVTQRFLTKPRPVGLSRTGSKTTRAQHLAYPRERASAGTTSSVDDPKNSISRGHRRDPQVASNSPLVASAAKHVVVPESPTTSHANRQLPGFHETHVCRESRHTMAVDSVEANSVVPATPVKSNERSDIRKDDGRISPIVSQPRHPGRANDLRCKAYSRNAASRKVIFADKFVTAEASKSTPSELLWSSRFESRGDSQRQRRKLGGRTLEIESQGRGISARGKKRARQERPLSGTCILPGERDRQRQADRLVPSPPREHSRMLPGSSLELEEAGNDRTLDEAACLGVEKSRPTAGCRQAIEDNSRERRRCWGDDEEEETAPIPHGGEPEARATYPETPEDLLRAADDNREVSGASSNGPVANGSPLSGATSSASVVENSAVATFNRQVGLGCSSSSGVKASKPHESLTESPSFTEGKERENDAGHGPHAPSSRSSPSSSTPPSPPAPLSPPPPSSVKGCAHDGGVSTSVVDAPACTLASLGVEADATSPSRTAARSKSKGLEEDKPGDSGAISTRTSPGPTTPGVERRPESCQDVHPSPEGFGRSPPERSFTLEHQRMFKGASGGRGRVGKARGRGRGVASRNFRRKPRGPVPAQHALVGVWRTQQSNKGKSSSKWYVALDGQKLVGKEAYRAAQMDRMKLASVKECRVIDRSTIMRRTSEASLGETFLHDDALKLSTFGVPQQLVDSYARRGVRRLYPWQAHCLRVDNGKPLSGGNLVYSAPTSGGKTLVAELLLLRALLQHNGTMALLVVPFIALATEKRDYLRDVWAPLELSVEAFHGAQGGESTMDGVNVAVCTIEKANSIINRLAEETRLEALSAVVVDEMHLIGDGGRGFLLELMLSKLRMVCPQKVQLVCLSATLPNADTVATWLDASLYQTGFRPVELRHHVCRGRVIYAPGADKGRQGEDQDAEAISLVKVGRVQTMGATTPGSDPDGVIDLVKESLAKDMSILVFCPTKAWCQKLAGLLAREIGKDGALRSMHGRRGPFASRHEVVESSATAHPEKGQGGVMGGKDGGGDTIGSKGKQAVDRVGPHGSGLGSRSDHRERTAERFRLASVEKTGETNRGRRTQENPGKGRVLKALLEVIEKLRETPVGLDPELYTLVKAGIAFHHSGLVVEERAVLEEAFRKGSLRVLVATSTLAAGVNLPAHRVIIRSPKMGPSDLDSTRYRQMAGRSGRAGVRRGEDCVTSAATDKLELASKLIFEPLSPLKSALQRATGGGLERALLEVVVGKIVKTRVDAERFLSHTLLAAEVQAGVISQACDAAMEFLVSNRFVVSMARAGDSEGVRDDQRLSAVAELSPTQLGKATFFSGLSPVAAIDVQRSLDLACGGLVTNTDLHALYLLSPLEGLEPDWERFREAYIGWGGDGADPAHVVGKAVGIQESVLVSASRHGKPGYGERFYTCPGSGRTVDLLPYRRFYAALVLQQAVEEVPLRDMAGSFGIARGVLQGLQKDAGVFCGMVVCFCRHLQWHELANVLFSFQGRLNYSTKPELLPLVRLSRDLPPFRARALFDGGYTGLVELAGADAHCLAELFLRCSPFRSAQRDGLAEGHRYTRARCLAENIQVLATNELLRILEETRSSDDSG